MILENPRRPYKLAAFLFLCPYFIAVLSVPSLGYAELPTRFLEWSLLPLLGLGVLLRGAAPFEIARLTCSVFLLAFLGVAYVLVEPDHPGLLLRYTAAYLVIYGLTFLFGALLFRPQDFIEVFFRLSMVSAGIGIGGWVVSIVMQEPILTNARWFSGAGAYRLQGLLTEPSAWAPVVGALILLGIRKRSYFALVLAITAMLLAQSPTVVLVAFSSCVLYALLASPWRASKIPLVVGALGASGAALGFLFTVNGARLLSSESFIDRVMGRLAIGVQGAFHGDSTAEARLNTTDVILRDVASGDRFMLGHGLNSASMYYEELYVLSDQVRAHSIWVRAAYELGLVGAVLVLVGIVLAMVRLSKAPELAAVFMPILMTSLISSAHQMNKMAVLGICLFSLGWLGRSGRDQELDSDALEGRRR